MRAESDDLHDSIPEGPARGFGPVEPTAAVLGFFIPGLVALLGSCIPVPGDFERWRNAVTMAPGIMSAWIAAGLGIYGLFRDRSRRMIALALAAVVVGLLYAVRFWLLAMPR
jgi:hypothetical protein